MKIFLPAFLALCFAVGMVAVAQDLPNQVPQKRQQAGIRLTSLMGTVRADGEKLTFVTDQRAWNVDNPETLKGHEGHYLRVNRCGARAAEFVQRIDRTPIQTTTNRKLALLMGRFTAEDAIKSIQNSRCSPELVSVHSSA